MDVQRPALSNGGNNIAVIYSNDWLAHIVADPIAAITQVNLCNPRVGMEFFDVEGYRLVPVFNLGWEMSTLCRTAAPPDPGMVINRLANWLGNVERYCSTATVSQIEREFPPHIFEDLSPDAVLKELQAIQRALEESPPLHGDQSIGEAFDIVRAFLDNAGGGSSGSAWHMALHAIGLAR